jgi:hypothetical protein
VQSGDQTGPDTTATDKSAPEDTTDPTADTDNVQSGDQAGPDTIGATG